VVFEESGHYPFIEQAREFWAVVGGFLSEYSSDTAKELGVSL
jgi:hypothetical protein